MSRETMIAAAQGVLVPVDDEDDDGAVYQCQNCEEFWKEAELVTPIKDIEQRVAPGEPMPARRVPDVRRGVPQEHGGCAMTQIQYSKAFAATLQAALPALRKHEPLALEGTAETLYELYDVAKRGALALPAAHAVKLGPIAAGARKMGERRKWKNATGEDRERLRQYGRLGGRPRKTGAFKAQYQGALLGWYETAEMAEEAIEQARKADQDSDADFDAKYNPNR